MAQTDEGTSGSAGSVSAGTGDLRLNLGCGAQQPKGWLNVDGSPGVWLSRHPLTSKILRAVLPARFLPSEWPPGCFHAQLTKRLPWADGTVSAVYSSHFVEHLSLAEARGLLRECHRVLRPGGILRTIVPDLERLVGDYHRNQERDAATAAERFLKDSGFFDVPPPRSPLGVVSYYFKVKNNHGFFYDEASLRAEYEAAGFVDVERKDCGDSAIEGIEDVDLPDRFLGSLCLEGRCP